MTHAFTYLVFLVDGMEGEDRRVVERRLTFLLANKYHREYSKMVVLICSWMSLAVVRSNTILTKGQWEL